MAPMEKSWFSKTKTYRNLKSKTVSYIGAPLAAGQHMAGVDKAPRALREGGIAEVAQELGWDFNDVGDLDMEKAMRDSR